MTTNKTAMTWPLTADAWKAVDHAARVERARAFAAFGRGIVAMARRMFGFGGPTMIYVPATRGRLTA